MKTKKDIFKITVAAMILAAVSSVFFLSCKNNAGGGVGASGGSTSISADAVGDNYDESRDGDIPTAENHKRDINPSELNATEWAKEGKDGLWEYLIFSTNDPFDPSDPETWYRGGYGNSRVSQAAAKTLAEECVNDDILPYPDFDNPVKYTFYWYVKNNEEIVCSLSNQTLHFWMNNQGRIVAQFDGNEVTNVYVKAN